MRRRHLVAAITALAIVGLAETTVRAIEPSLGQPQLWPTEVLDAKANRLEQLGHTDLVVLGSSALAVDVDPGVVLATVPSVETAYNAAFPLGHPDVLQLWFADVVRPAVQPDIVLIELLPQSNLPMRPNGFDVALVDSVGYRSATGRPWEEVLGGYVALVRHRPTLQEPGELFRRLNGARAERLVDDTGFRASSEPYRFTEAYEEALRRDLADPDAPDRWDHLIDLIDAVEAAGAEVILVVAPIYERDFYAIDPSIEPAWLAFLTRVEAVAAERDLTFIDTRTVRWERSEFSDPAHMNADGAARFSEWLAGELETALQAP